MSVPLPRGARRVGVALALALLTALSPASALAAPARASLTDIKNDVMCTECHESLAVAQSAEAYREIKFIRGLISQGLTKPQIESQLVANYGPSVLGKPPATGFNLVVYVVPPLLVVLGIALLLVLIPKWRRRSRLVALAPLQSGPSLNPAEARRLDEDLARRI